MNALKPKKFNFNISLPEITNKQLLGWMLAAFTAYSGYNLHLHQATNDKTDKIVSATDTIKNTRWLVREDLELIKANQIELKDDFNLIGLSNQAAIAECRRNHIADSTNIDAIAEANLRNNKTLQMLIQSEIHK